MYLESRKLKNKLNKYPVCLNVFNNVNEIELTDKYMVTRNHNQILVDKMVSDGTQLSDNELDAMIEIAYYSGRIIEEARYALFPSKLF